LQHCSLREEAMSNVVPLPIARAGTNWRATREVSPVDWSSAVAQPAFRELLRLKWRVIALMLALYSVFFSGLMLLAGYARPLMAAAVLENLDVGYILIIATFLMCWALALLYVFAADSAFDPKSHAVARSFDSGDWR
jgi:uncharacterized membrane protein (DUF485 family)